MLRVTGGFWVWVLGGAIGGPVALGGDIFGGILKVVSCGGYRGLLRKGCGWQRALL